jgi:hypothetical protein
MQGRRYRFWGIALTEEEQMFKRSAALVPRCTFAPLATVVTT